MTTRRFEKGVRYTEVKTSGTDLSTWSGIIGKRAGEPKFESFPNARALRTRLDARIQKLLAAGFSETPDDGLTAKLDRLEALANKIDAPSARKALELVKGLEALGPHFRKRLAEAGFDARRERARFYTRLGGAAFREQERRYWALVDRSGLPNMSMPIYMFDYDTVNRAMKSPGARPKLGGARPDYRVAIRELERAVELAPAADDDAPTLLAVIAIRREDYAAAARWLTPLTKRKERGSGLASFLLGVASACEGKWPEAEARFQEMGKRALGLTNLAFVAWHRENDSKAIDLLGRALRLDADNGYATFHLKRLEQKASATSPAATAAAKVKSRAQQLKKRIVIRSAREFYEKVGEIGDALRLLHDISAPPSPLPEAEIAGIRIAKFRNRTTVSCGLPESVKAILRYDRNFRLWGAQAPLLRRLRRSDRVSVVPSLDIERIVRSEANDPVRRTFKKLPKDVAVWNDDPTLPACIEIATPADQRIFLYVGDADAQGELPIARFDPEPCVWITNASLLHLVVDAAIEEGVAIDCSIDFEAQLRKSIRRNGHHEEKPKAGPQP